MADSGGDFSLIGGHFSVFPRGAWGFGE